MSFQMTIVHVCMTMCLHNFFFFFCIQITCCECVCNGQMIVSGGTGGVVSFWKIYNSAQFLRYHGKVRHLRGHDGAINCLAACKPFSVVVTGSSDRTAIIWDTNRCVG